MYLNHIRGLARLANIRLSSDRLTLGTGTGAQDGFHAFEILGQALRLVLRATMVLRSHNGERCD